MNSEADKKRILLVEDDPELPQLLRIHLEAQLFRVDVAVTGPIALEKARTGIYDLLLLDVQLPELSGFDVLKRLRSESNNVPVIMLTSRDQELDKIAGFTYGADDYLTKPFSIAELIVRIQAILRRAGTAESAASAGEKIYVGPLLIDPAARTASLDGKLLTLTHMEFELLSFLAANPERVFSREQILDAVWHSKQAQYELSVNSIVSRIRKKLESHPVAAHYIKTIRSVGYKFSVEPE